MFQNKNANHSLVLHQFTNSFNFTVVFLVFYGTPYIKKTKITEE